ncbi:MAG: TonB family protein [Pseudomonadota bacterium]
MAFLFARRDQVAAFPSLLLFGVLVANGIYGPAALKPKYDEAVKVEIIDIAEAPEIIQPPPPPPAPPLAPVPPSPQVPAPAEPLRPQPPVAVATTMPSAIVDATPAPVLSAALPQPVPELSRPAVNLPSVQKPAEPPLVRSNASLEGEYIGKLRAYLNSIKRYPTGREASLQRPQGAVRLFVVLRRDGSVQDSGIDESSNSLILDDAGKKTVARAAFPPFPEEFKPGEATHRFTVELQFAPAN